MKLSDANRELQNALKKLERSGGRIARRNARLALFALLRSIKLAAHKAYPAIKKANPPAPPQPEKIKKLRLPFVRPFTIEAMKLFGDVVEDVTNVRRLYTLGWPPAPHTDARCWKDTVKVLSWSWCIHEQSQAWNQIMGIYAAFWSGLLELHDIELANAHQQFLDEYNAKRKRRKHAAQTT